MSNNRDKIVGGFELKTILLRFCFMNEKDFFEKVIEIVSNVSGLEVGAILHSNREECVDARYVLVAVLAECLSDRQIALASGLSVQLVNKAKNCFRERCKYRWGLKQMFDECNLIYSNLEGIGKD
jgi:hypothetical protein